MRVGTLQIELQNLRTYVPTRPIDLAELATFTDRLPMQYPRNTPPDVIVERMFLDEEWLAHLVVPGDRDSIQMVITGYEGIRRRYRTIERQARRARAWSRRQRRRLDRAWVAYRVVSEDPKSETSKSVIGDQPMNIPRAVTELRPEEPDE